MMHETTGKPCVIVTGSSGRIGAAVINRLAQNYDIFALDVVGPSHPLPEHADFVEMDVTSDPSVQNAIAYVEQNRDGPIASVVHLAAYYDFSGEPSDLYEKVTVEGTRRLLKALRPQRPQQFIFSSTLLIHAPTRPGEPIREDSPIQGAWDYPHSKIETETVIRKERGDIPAVFLRIAGVYSDDCDSIPLAQQIRRMYENQLTARVFPGDLAHGQAFVHMDDVVDAIVRTVDRRLQLPREAIALLIAEPTTYSYDTLQRTLAKLIHDDDDWTTMSIPKFVAKTGAWVQGKVPKLDDPFIKPWMIDRADDHYEVDIAQARKLLEWEPQHRLIDTLPKMVRTLRADPSQWYLRHKLQPPAPAQRKAV